MKAISNCKKEKRKAYINFKDSHRMGIIVRDILKNVQCQVRKWISEED